MEFLIITISLCKTKYPCIIKMDLFTKYLFHFLPIKRKSKVKQINKKKNDCLKFPYIHINVHNIRSSQNKTIKESYTILTISPHPHSSSESFSLYSLFFLYYFVHFVHRYGNLLSVIFLWWLELFKKKKKCRYVYERKNKIVIDSVLLLLLLCVWRRKGKYFEYMIYIDRGMFFFPYVTNIAVKIHTQEKEKMKILLSILQFKIFIFTTNMCEICAYTFAKKKNG